MTRKLRIPPGRFCSWLNERTNPSKLISTWPFGIVCRLRFYRGGGAVALFDRTTIHDVESLLTATARRVCVLEMAASPRVEPGEKP